jgi:uncharacterized membrane-anchored protein
MLPPRNHPDREAITSELHARPMEIVEGAERIRRLVFVVPTAPAELEALHQRFRAFCASLGIDVGQHPRQISFPVGALRVTWEFHTEFVTVTWQAPPNDGVVWPDGIGLDVLAGSDLIASTLLDVTDEDTVPDAWLDGLDLASRCASTIEDGSAELASDYVPDADGFTVLMLAAGRLSVLRRSVQVRRVLEMETYRCMALLGLPAVRRGSSDLGRAERDLEQLIETLGDATTAESIKAALDTLHRLSIQSSRLSERLDYRLSGSKAYGDILHARLESLREGPTTRGSSIGRFVANRVDPALRTCAAFEKRLGSLTNKIARVIDLLNVRIGLDMQTQQSAVLDTIASTAQSQYRLQATVEGLSVIAISYYLLGILGYLLGGPLETFHIDKPLALSVAAPIAVLLVWLAIRRIRRRHFG